MKTTEELQAQLNQRIEECGGDILTYLKKYNRHTLKISLINEQVGEEVWEGTSITFYNEDNALSHMCILAKFLELLTQEENKSWGYEHTEKEVVENILNPIQDMLLGKN